MIKLGSSIALHVSLGGTYIAHTLLCIVHYVMHSVLLRFVCMSILCMH